MLHCRQWSIIQTKSRKNDPVIFYELSFRVVRFRITSDTFETVLTNLDADNYPPEELKKLYATRWGLEVFFKNLMTPAEFHDHFDAAA